MKQFAAKILLVLISPALFLGITETAFRQFGGDRVKNYYVHQAEEALGKPVPNKQAGEYRAFLYGGSSAYGFPVTDRSSVTAWLNRSFEKLLPGVKVRVINSAWPGKASHHDVEGALTAAERLEPDLFIVYTGHNEANITNRMYAESALHRFNLKLSFRSAFYMWLMGRIERLQKFMAKNRPQVQPREEIIAQKLYSRPEVTREEYDKITAHFRKNIETILRLAKKQGIPVVLVTPASNIREIAPRGSVHRADLTADSLARWEEAFERGKKHFEGAKPSEAVAAFEEALALDAEHAGLHFYYAQALEKTGDLKQARLEFLRARDTDAIPTRAKTELIEILKDFENPPQVMLADMEEVFEKISPGRIIGFEYIYDDVHPTVKGQQIIAEAVLRQLSANHWIKPSSEWQWGEFEKLRASELWQVEATREAYHDVLTALLLWQQKNYKGAAEAFEKGIVSMPGFIESYAFLGDSYYRTGNPGKALTAFKTLQQKDPVLEKALREKYPDLQEAYSRL
jgi:tetratricopeptide (TPR) repeat protein